MIQMSWETILVHPFPMALTCYSSQIRVFSAEAGRLNAHEKYPLKYVTVETVISVCILA